MTVQTAQIAKTLPESKRAPDLLRQIGTAQHRTGDICWNFLRIEQQQNQEKG